MLPMLNRSSKCNRSSQTASWLCVTQVFFPRRHFFSGEAIGEEFLCLLVREGWNDHDFITGLKDREITRRSESTVFQTYTVDVDMMPNRLPYCFN